MPTSTSSIFKLGQSLVRDQVVQEARDVKLKEIYQQSHFSRRRKSSVRGVKDGAVQIMRCPDGGFIHIPKPNSRLELDALLDKFRHIKETRDKYSTKDRPLYKESPIVPFKNHVEQEEDAKRGSFLQYLENERDDLLSPRHDVSLSHSPMHM